MFSSQYTYSTSRSFGVSATKVASAQLGMSVLQMLSLHRPSVERTSDPIRPLTVLEGLLALVALVVFVGALAGAFTYALVRLFTSAVG